MQLNDVYDRYTILKNALVESDPDKAGQESLTCGETKETLKY